MKKILIITFLTLGLATFANEEPKKRVRVSKMLVTKLSTGRKKEEWTYKLTYGKHDYIEKIVIDKINTYGIEGEGLIKQFNRDEVHFAYNTKDQLISETYYKYVGSEKKQGKKISYSYDEQGYIISRTLIHGKVHMKNTYEYNEKCFLSEAVRSMKAIDMKIFWNYVYDDKDNLVELDLKSGELFSNSTSYFFDDKKNPLKTMYPKKYCLVLPEVYGKNNPTEVEEVSNKYTKKHKTEYTYESTGYPKESVQKYYEDNKLETTTTTKYFYENIIKTK